MPSIAQLAQAVRLIFQHRASIAARLHGLARRERLLSGPQFVQTLVGGFLADPHATYETLAEFAADLGAPVSPQALAKRVAQPAVATLADLLAATTQQVLAADPLAASLLARFAAVTVEDSTVIGLPDALADLFPGCGGNRNNAKAALKAQFRWELRSGRLEGPLLHEGRASDRAVSFRERVAKGTLRLRDLGYWQLEDLKRDSDDGRFWLMRLKPGTALFLPDGTRHDLLSLLATSSGNQAEWNVELGVQQRVKSRLFARRVSTEEVGKRQRRAAATAKRKGRTLSQAAETRCSWEVLVTNVPEEVLNAEEAWVLYGLRWQIELLFKLWKSHGGLDTSRGSEPERVMAELYAKFIALLVQHWLLLAGCWQHADRSLVKAARVVRRWAERLFRALNEGPGRLEAVLEAMIAAIGRAGRQTRRKKEPGAWQLLAREQSLPEPNSSEHENR